MNEQDYQTNKKDTDYGRHNQQKEDLDEFNRQYLKNTPQVAETCQDFDLSDNCMVIGTSAIVDTEIDGAVGMYKCFN